MEDDLKMIVSIWEMTVSMCPSTIAPRSGQPLNSGPIKASEGDGASAPVALRAFWLLLAMPVLTVVGYVPPPLYTCME